MINVVPMKTEAKSCHEETLIVQRNYRVFRQARYFNVTRLKFSICHVTLDLVNPIFLATRISWQDAQEVYEMVVIIRTDEVAERGNTIGQ